MKLFGIHRARVYWPGVVYTGLVTLIGLAAMNNQNNLLFWVFGVMVSGLAISWIVATVGLRRLLIRRLDPGHGEVGEPLIVRYAVSNRSRWISVFNIHLQERETSGRSTWHRIMYSAVAWVMHIEPRNTVHGEAVFWPRHRGRVSFDRIRVWTTFPFGLYRKSKLISQPQHTLIYPRLYELQRNVLKAVAPKALLGTKVAQHAGAGDDYFGMREYREGDSMRHVSWKRTAQFDQLITIERTTPSPAKLRIVLDLTLSTDQLRHSSDRIEDKRELEEKAISLAASLIRAADLDGYEVGLTILGFDQPLIPVRRSQWHFRKMMGALASIDLNEARKPSQTLPVREAERAGLIMIWADRLPAASRLPSRSDALFLTARQLDTLAIQPIGWDPSTNLSSESNKPNAELEAAA